MGGGKHVVYHTNRPWAQDCVLVKGRTITNQSRGGDERRARLVAGYPISEPLSSPQSVRKECTERLPTTSLSRRTRTTVVCPTPRSYPDTHSSEPRGTGSPQHTDISGCAKYLQEFETIMRLMGPAQPASSAVSKQPFEPDFGRLRSPFPQAHTLPGHHG